MADNEHREEQYAGTMGNQIMAFLETLAEGESHLEDLYEAKTKRAFEAGSFPFDLTQELGNTGEKLNFKVNYPRYMARNMHPFLAEEGEVSGDMNVHSSVSKDTKGSAESGFAGEGKIGYGPVSCKVKIHGKASASSEIKRKTDYRAGVKWRVLCKRQPPPEGIMMLIDAGAKMLDVDIELNLELGLAAIARLRSQYASGETEEETPEEVEDASEQSASTWDEDPPPETEEE